MKLIIPHKGISINLCWQGRRFKTVEYTKWRNEISALLMTIPHKQCIVNKSEYLIVLNVYIHNYSMADVDNFIKPILDSLKENCIIVDDRYVRQVNCIKHKIDKEEKEYFAVDIEETKEGIE